MDSSSARDGALLLTVSKCDRDCSLCVSVSLFHTRSDVLELTRRFRYLFGGSDRQSCSSPHSQLLPGKSTNSASHLAFALEVPEVKSTTPSAAMSSAAQKASAAALFSMASLDAAATRASTREVAAKVWQEIRATVRVMKPCIACHEQAGII